MGESTAIALKAIAFSGKPEGIKKSASFRLLFLMKGMYTN